MAAIEVGRVIVKTAGREALMKAVIVDLVDQNFVLISGGGVSAVKRRRCNIKHIRPLDTIISIKRGAKDDAIQKALEKADLLETIKEPIQITV
ncbi:50S ribosomal protein L14e [Candidatus Heimdallarchaeota archaeon B3_Heim]|nr:MAG: 50S ribosomal protein L14e [Candidatus Heimdallarchaeota archaeon B3_Heim]